MLVAGGIFGIHSHTASLAADLALVVLVVIWLALVYWTFADARRRIDDGPLIALATVTALAPFLGAVVYAIVRPPEYLEDVRERKLEIQAAQARLAHIGVYRCPYCDHEVEREFLRCPHCLRRLKEPCANCGKPLERSWQICPYCETERGIDPMLTRRSRRPRRDPRPEPAVTPPPADLI
ncbi:MAG: zinc ribbon domain-containing protein [Solirubrobacteraceae bacterium]